LKLQIRGPGLVAALFVLVALSCAGIGPAAADPEGSEEVVFPNVEGSNLQGAKFELPGDFEGDLNLVLIAFKREQQELVDTWLPFARSLEDRFEEFRYYELPTIYKANAAYRWMINNGMRMGIKDPKARAVTITLFLDKEKFREALEIPHEGTIYALLVEKSGRVVWRVDGTLSRGKQRAVEEVLSNRFEAEE
jgi:hypothetical protein